MSSDFRPTNGPLDGVNFLADRFESCSLDEGKRTLICNRTKKTNCFCVR